MKVIIKKIIRVFDDFFKIDKATLQHEKFDGTMTPELTRLNFNRGHSVAIILYNPDTKSVILTRQFRFPAYFSDKEKGWLLEVIAGMLEKDENPEEALQREIFEETGFQVPRMEFINEFFVSPGGSSEKIYLYFGVVTRKHQVGNGGGLKKEGEDIRIEEIPFEQALEMVQQGKISDAKTIIALLWLEKQLKIR